MYHVPVRDWFEASIPSHPTLTAPYRLQYLQNATPQCPHAGQDPFRQTHTIR